MKEATGELNMSVIVISAAALLSAVFFMVIWPMVKQEFKDDATCANAVCDSGYDIDTGMSKCINPSASDDFVFECPYRG